MYGNALGICDVIRMRIVPLEFWLQHIALRTIRWLLLLSFRMEALMQAAPVSRISAEYRELEKSDPLLKENPRRWVLLPIQYPAVFEMYKKLPLLKGIFFCSGCFNRSIAALKGNV